MRCGCQGSSHTWPNFRRFTFPYEFRECNLAMPLCKFCSFIFLPRGCLMFFAFYGVIISELHAGTFLHLSGAPQLRNFVIYPSEEIWLWCQSLTSRPLRLWGTWKGVRSQSIRGRVCHSWEKNLRFKHAGHFGGKSHGCPDLKRQKNVFLSTKF